MALSRAQGREVKRQFLLWYYCHLRSMSVSNPLSLDLLTGGWAHGEKRAVTCWGTFGVWSVLEEYGRLYMMYGRNTTSSGSQWARDISDTRGLGYVVSARDSE